MHSASGARVADVPASTAGRLVLASRLLDEIGHRTLAHALLVDAATVSLLPQIFAPDEATTLEEGDAS